MRRVERSALGIFKVGPVFSNKFDPLCPHNRISWKLMQSKSLFPRVFHNFDHYGCEQRNISLLLPPLSLFPPYWIASLCTHIDITGCCHVVFWPRGLNAIFRGKIAQLSALVKSPIFELFCLQNSLIVGMQPQVSGKVGSFVGWLVGWLVGFWVDHVRHSRRLSNFTERLVVGAGTKMQMRTHGKFCY